MGYDSLEIANGIYSQEQFNRLLLEKYPWAEDYCYYYIYIIFAIRDSIVPVLESILPEDRDTYTPEKAYDYLRKYEMSRLRFCTIIPTCDRPKAIKYLVEYAAVLYRRYAIDLIIYDSSSNEETYEIVQDIRSKGYLNVIYKRYTGEFDGFSLDHKVMKAYEEYADQYDYLWLCRDGLIPVVDEFLEKLRYYKKRDFDCIIVDTKSRIFGLDIEKYYTTIEDCNTFLTDQADRLQTLGMLILSGKLAKRLLETEPLRDATYSLWQMSAPFHAFAKKPYKAVFCTKNVFAPNYFASPTHFWSKASKTLEQWAYRWSTIIENMPSEYDDAKKKCMMVYTIDFHPFSGRNLLEMRAYGGLTYKMVKKYEEYIPKVTVTPLWLFKFVALCPPCAIKMVLKLDQKHHGAISKIKQLMIHDRHLKRQ